jgi:DNA-binding response OmpR family regulator
MPEGIYPLVWRSEVTRLLLIEDCQETRAWMHCVLKCDGFDLIEARDGLAGLQRAVQDAPDLILISAELPGLTGLDVCERLAAEPSTGAVPILMVADDPCPGLQRALNQLGVAGAVLRSFRSEVFTALVRAGLRARGTTWASVAERVREKSSEGLRVGARVSRVVQ